MKEVIFKSLAVRNFLSIGQEPITIDFNTGINIITGVNLDKTDSKNGVGKSTILDALFFGLFGETLRSLKKDDIVNWVTKEECNVVVYFDVISNGHKDEYISKRCINPSRVQLIKNGEDISRTIGKTKGEIFEILGTTPEMFAQSVVLSLNDTESFLSKTPAVKRSFIEDIFQIEIFSRMTKHIKDDHKKTKLNLENENDKLNDLEASIRSYQKQQQEQQNRKAAQMITLNDRISQINENISALNKKIEEIPPTDETKVETIKNLLNELNNAEQEKRAEDKKIGSELAALNTRYTMLRTKAADIERTSNGVCIYCGQAFSEDNLNMKKQALEEVNNEMTTIMQNIKKLGETNKGLTQIFLDLDLKKKHYNDLLQTTQKSAANKSSLMTQLNLLERQRTQTQDDIDNLSKESNEIDNFINDIEIRKNNLLVLIDEYKHKIGVIESAQFIVSSEGVKNLIIKKMLKLLNGRLNYYLTKLDAPCTCTFDGYFDETLKNSLGRECSYFNFSGGERKRIDLAMLFTFMDIRRIQSNITTNIGLYDELLDTALDAVGIENTLNILKERVDNNKEAIYIISHKNEAAKHASGEIIYLEKENGITKRKIFV